MSDIDKEKINIGRAMKALNYTSILMDHGIDKEDGIEKLIENLIRVFETIPIMVDHMDFDHKNLLEDDAAYDALRLTANICMFIDSALPIINKYNPSDEDKARFVDYIKKMEENKDE